MTSQPAPRRAVIRWSPLKGSTAIIVFVAVVALAEFLVVLYAMDLGVKDMGEWTSVRPITITISPLFHLVPVAVIITLSFSWIYLTKKLSTRPLVSIGRTEIKQSPSKKSQLAKSAAEKAKPISPSAKGISRIWQRIYSGRATLKSATIVFLSFVILVVLMSQLAFPGAIYQTLTSSYSNHSPLYNLVTSVANSFRGFAKAVSPIGSIATAINNGLIAASPGVRDVGMAFGSLIGPLANLDPAGKYLFFQNAAAFISVFLVLLYGQYGRRSYRYRKKK